MAYYKFLKFYSFFISAQKIFLGSFLCHFFKTEKLGENI